MRDTPVAPGLVALRGGGRVGKSNPQHFRARRRFRSCANNSVWAKAEIEVFSGANVAQTHPVRSLPTGNRAGTARNPWRSRLEFVAANPDRERHSRHGTADDP